MFPKCVIPVVLAAMLLPACSHRGAAQQDQVESQAAFHADYTAMIKRCQTLADRSPKTWGATYWTCMRDDEKIIWLKYDLPNPDLRAFRYDYALAIARRADAGLLTLGEAKAAIQRVDDAVNAEGQRRQDEENARQAESEAADRAARSASSLSALAIGLGAIVRNQPPPPETTLYNFGGTAVTCTHWQNVVNCY